MAWKALANKVGVNSEACFDDHFAMKKWQNWKSQKDDYKAQNKTRLPKPCRYGCAGDYFTDPNYQKERQNTSLKDFTKFRRYADWADYCKVANVNPADMVRHRGWKATHNKMYRPENFRGEYQSWKNEPVPIDAALPNSQVVTTAANVVNNAAAAGQPIAVAAPTTVDQTGKPAVVVPVTTSTRPTAGKVPSGTSSKIAPLQRPTTQVVPAAQVYCGFDLYKKWHDWKQWRKIKGCSASMEI